MIVCKVCGEEGGSTGSMRGLVHKYGPVDHAFEPVDDFQLAVAQSTVKPTYTPADAGCYVDGCRGIYAVDAIVDFARAHGAIILDCDYSAPCCEGNHADTCNDSDFAGCEFADEIEDESDDFMNEHFPVDGHYWGRSESGDWGLWPSEDD